MLRSLQRLPFPGFLFTHFSFFLSFSSCFVRRLFANGMPAFVRWSRSCCSSSSWPPTTWTSSPCSTCAVPRCVCLSLLSPFLFPLTRSQSLSPCVCGAGQLCSVKYFGCSSLCCSSTSPPTERLTVSLCCLLSLHPFVVCCCCLVWFYVPAGRQHDEGQDS